MKRLISGRKKSKKVRLRADSICTQPDFSIMGFSLLSEMEFFAVPKNGISLNI